MIKKLLTVLKRLQDFFCGRLKTVCLLIKTKYYRITPQNRIIACIAAGFFILTLSITIHIVYMKTRGDIFSGIEFSNAYCDKDGKLLQVFLTNDDKYRIYRPIEEFPDDFIEALLLQEDRHFYHHIGINPVAIVKAGWETYIKHSRRMGASTITMQVAKLKYKLYTKNIFGKTNQIIKALYLELCFSKRQILEAYVNLAPCGGNVEGFETASWYYFSKGVNELNLSQNIMLCVLPQNPVKRAPSTKFTPSDLFDARKILFKEWAEHHPEDSDKETFMDMQISVECSFPNEARHFTEMLALNNITYKKSRKQKSYSKPLRTSIDLELQHKCEELFNLYLSQNRNFGVKNGAILLLDWKEMNVVANIGSADYYNDEIEGKVNATTSKRSPGSALKPFIYALALEQGKIHSHTMLKDTPQAFSEYMPDNYGSTFKGPVHAWFALADSRNIPAIALNREIKEHDLYDFMKEAHVTGMKEKDHYGLSIVLGTCDVTMLELAQLYAVLANNGVYHNAKFAQNAHIDKGERLLSAEAAFITRKMLEKNTPPYESKPKEAEGIPIAYKTGTSIGFNDSWSAGIFYRYIIIVWFGNFNGQGNNAFLGRRMSAPLLFNIAYSILSSTPKQKLLKPEMPPKNAVQIPVCQVSGALPGDDCENTELAWFIPGTSPIEKCRIHRKINIDSRTGYRTDDTPDENPFVKTVVREFWPSDIQQLFEQAGLPRLLPPDYPPDESKYNLKQQGYPPEIISPISGADYIFRLNNTSKNTIMLCASADADTSELLWFSGSNFIGRTKPGQNLEWKPQPGTYRITVTDQKGRADFVDLTIRSTEL